MFKSKNIYIVILFLASLVISPMAQTQETTIPTQEIDAFLETSLDRLNIPGAVLAVVEGDELVFLHSYGNNPPEYSEPMMIGSITKSFTAMAVMQLHEGGQLSLDEPIQTYLPWFRLADPTAASQITVRHLLNQTSGLPQIVGMRPLADFDQDPGATLRLAKGMAELDLTRPVGSAFEYSNMNFNLLGLIIEAVSNQSYGEYIQENIFTPLDMQNSFTERNNADPAMGHRLWFGIPKKEPNLPVPLGSLPSGQILASLEDMTHYLMANLNEGNYGSHSVLSPRGISQLHSPGVRAEAMGMDMGSYAMGWFVKESSVGTIVTHHGTVPDYFAFLSMIPHEDKGMVLLVNANHLIYDGALQTICLEATKLLGGGQAEEQELSSIPWILRAFLLIPLLQILSVILFLRGLHKTGAEHKPIRKILPLLPHLLLPLAPLFLFAARLTRFMALFLPDLTWLFVVCGLFGLAWSVLRTVLLIRFQRKHSF